MNFKETGARIKSRRQFLGLSAEDVAEAAGCSPSTVYRYENGDISSMRVDRLPLIAAALSVSEAWLAGWEDEAPAPVRISKQDEQLLSAYHAAPSEIRAIVDTALAPYREDGLSDLEAI